MTTKKIGFIDFFLDEWHANNFPAWIRENCQAEGRDIELAYAWAQTDAPGGMDTAAWCAKYHVQNLPTIAEVVERSDFLIVLSPDHPEHHETLAELALMSGKPTYIDKTFSPDMRSGARMFDLAEKHHTPMYSSSPSATPPNWPAFWKIQPAATNSNMWQRPGRENSRITPFTSSK